jgi:hypothetical protein
MNPAVLPNHHELLARLVENGAGLNLAPSSATLPLGGAVLQQSRHSWELVWVQIWPENRYALHRQPFSVLTANANGTLSLKDLTGALRGWIRPLDRYHRRECNWEQWVAPSDAAQRSRELVEDLLRNSKEAYSTVPFRRFGGRISE